MNLEIANRLVALRKENNLSQEALAERLGISRQAVSKWERAEASPDTDNLIALAKLYHVSLDELLKIHEDETGETVNEAEKNTELAVSGSLSGKDTVMASENSRNEESTEERGQSGAEKQGGAAENVHIGFDGIHVNDKDAEVHVSWHGIHVYDKKKDEDVRIDKNGVRVNGEEASGQMFSRGKGEELPLSIIAILVYIIIGFCFGLWHPGWLIFFLVPVISTLITAVRHHNPDQFAYPVLALLIFLYIGLVYSRWHPTWVVFLTIPVYYSVTNYIRRTRTKDYEED